MMNRGSGITINQVLIAITCLCVALIATLFPLLRRQHHEGKVSRMALSMRRITFSSIQYSGDYDDTIVLALRGRLSRLQDRSDRQLTINCPGPGTQGTPDPTAGGAQASRTWVQLLGPYMTSQKQFIDPERGDRHGIYSDGPLAVGEKNYGRTQNTWRNQGRFPMLGVNYLCLSPISIPKTHLKDADALNYAEGQAIKFSASTDPSGTIFYAASQRSMDDTDRGLFVVNAPGMWRDAYASKDKLAISDGTGSGEWIWGGVNKSISNGNVYIAYRGGSDVAFLDGHVKFLKDAALAAGTDYISGVPGVGLKTTCKIIDRAHYLWDLQ
jgi:prepilin-type processing-associated H-X9-DG protein